MKRLAILFGLAGFVQAQSLSYRIVGTGQDSPSYTLSADGLTVHDNNTGLTWQRGPAREKLTWDQAQTLPASLNTARYGGFTDWRLPGIKELYSLILFSGTDPSGPPGMEMKPTPFIDTRYFKFAYGKASRGERIIDSQYASSTMYVYQRFHKLFGVNFADGRIKGYDLRMPGRGEKTFFVQCVRGGAGYGVNHFIDNGDGTVTDTATGLMWPRDDSGSGMNWSDALAWVQRKNGAHYLGHGDWRLPDAKELQSIVDYSRSPDTSNSAAIDPLFRCTQITNEAGQPDFPYYWTSTTHVAAGGPPDKRNSAAVYIAFGRGLGFIDGAWRDVHGAGTQRSDPKSGDPADYPKGRGPQGDAIRINNFVRMVRSVR